MKNELWKGNDNMKKTWKYFLVGAGTIAAGFLVYAFLKEKPVIYAHTNRHKDESPTEPSVQKNNSVKHTDADKNDRQEFKVTQEEAVDISGSNLSENSSGEQSLRLNQDDQPESMPKDESTANHQKPQVTLISDAEIVENDADKVREPSEKENASKMQGDSKENKSI